MSIFKEYFKEKFNRKYNKSFYQNYSEKNIEQSSYFNRDIRSFFKLNNVYNNQRQKRNNRFSRMKIINKIEKKMLNERNFDKYEHDKTYNNVKRNKYRDRKIISKYDDKNIEKNKVKIKTYFAQKNENLHEANDDIDYENYYYSQNLNCFDFDYDEKNDTKITINLLITFRFTCRRCKTIMKFSNALHKHLKICVKIVDVNSVAVYINSNKKFLLTLNSISIKNSNVDVNKDIDTNYEFKEFQYASIEIALIENDNFTSICTDIETEITLIGTVFFKSAAKKLQIKTMINFITIRDLNRTKNFIDKYVIVPMYFLEKNKSETMIKVKRTKKVHLISILKANMFIKNDVLKSKKFDIFISISSIYIDSCDVIILIFIKSRFVFQSKSLHFTKSHVISSRIEINIFIHRITLFERDYLFEFAETNFSFYCYIIDIIISVILIRNNNNMFSKIFRNFLSNKFVELKYAFYLNMNSSNFVICRIKSKHKKTFFQQILKSIMQAVFKNFNEVFVNIFLFVKDEELHASKNIVFSNNVTVHDSSQNVVDNFTNLITEYSSL